VNFDASLLVIMGIFWITYLILRFYFFQPMFELLAAREGTIATARHTHEEALGETSDAIEAEEGRLAEVRAASAAQRERLRRKALEQRQEILAHAKTVAQEEIEEAQRQLEEQVARERVVLERRAHELARVMAERLLGRAV
jgi:F0F1-type ATP synthase membrane subunit b/b'